MVREEDLTTYGEYLQNIARLHPDTVASHLRHVRRFLSFTTAKQRQLDALPEGFMDIFFRESAATLSMQTKAFASMQRYCDYCLKQETLSANPFQGMARPRQRRKTYRYWTTSEIERLLAAPDIKTAIGLRDRTLIEFIYDTGMRNHEVRRLTLPDLHMEERHVIVRGKGYKERAIPLNDGAVYWLEQYLPRRHELFTDKITPILFPSTSTGDAMSGMNLWYIVKQHAKSAGLEPSFNVHSLRHAFASHMITNGADLYVVKELLGHSHIATTETYTHLEAAHLKELHRRHHPRADFPPEETEEAGSGNEKTNKQVPVPG